jgi:hypothetical protein
MNGYQQEDPAHRCQDGGRNGGSAQIIGAVLYEAAVNYSKGGYIIAQVPAKSIGGGADCSTGSRPGRGFSQELGARRTGRAVYYSLCR